MPPVEIDETELTRLRGIEAVAAKVSQHPEGRKLLEQAVATAMPERAAPEVRFRAELDEVKKSILDEIKADREARQKAEDERIGNDRQAQIERRWTTGRTLLRDRGYNDEGVAAVEKLMEDRGLADHEAAMALFERLNPPPPPAMHGGNSWNFFDQRESVDFKPLFEGNEEGFLGQAIGATLKEIRGR